MGMIAITGHTSGIGKALTDVFPNYIGFSRSNGYDLVKIEDRYKMYQLISECDIFINNAPIGWAQITLLYELWEYWKDKDKIIVNIGSNSSDYNQNIAKPYSIQKRALEDACLQLQHSMSKCKCIVVKPGYVDTPRVEKIDALKINPDELATFIKGLTDFQASFWIPVVTLYPR